MLLTKENLALAKIASDDVARGPLTGVLVDPKGGVTAASNGHMLVEISALKENGDKPFPTGGQRLAGSDDEPFIVPASKALEAAKGAKEGAAVAVDATGRPTLLASQDAKKSVPIRVEPLEGSFPEYRNDGIFGKGESITVGFSAENLRLFLAAAAIGSVVKLTLFSDRMRLESQNDRGQSARGVLMCFGKPAGRAPVKPTPPAESEAPSERPEPAHASGRRHYWRRRPKLDPTKPPTEGQIAFYCYLLFRRDQKIAPRHFAEEGMVGKIEELKKNLPVDQGKCTWPQWRKLFGLLAEKAELKARCQVLNGLSSVSQASSAIDEWLKKSEAMEPEEAAA